jgi:hypothetical protein
MGAIEFLAVRIGERMDSAAIMVSEAIPPQTGTENRPKQLSGISAGNFRTPKEINSAIIRHRYARVPGFPQIPASSKIGRFGALGPPDCV